MNTLANVTRRGAVAVLTIDNPPVNALGHAVRTSLFELFGELAVDPAVEAIVLACAGRTFVAGADIRELGVPMAFPGARAVFSRIEDCAKPVVATIHGTALGGGLELALVCGYRVATRDARLGLPEVKLGLLPGAGGSQRLPRAVGPELAVRMVVTGEPIGAEEALRGGLIDAIVDDPVSGGVEFARLVLAAGGRRSRLRDDDTRLGAARDDRTIYTSAAAAALKKMRGLASARAAAEAVGWALDLPFDEAMDKEAESFRKLLDDEQSRAQRHAFFAERQAGKIAAPAGHTAREVSHVAVIGGGMMGVGIAMSFANAGLPVTLIEQDAQRLEISLGAIGKTYEAQIARGGLSAEEMAARRRMLRGAVGIEAVGDADLVVEAVFEDMELKKEIFRRIDRHAKPGAVLATNTSYLDIDAMADATGRPSDVLGMHFFSPANVMKLCEIIRASGTGVDALLTVRDVAKRIGKVPVVVGLCDGFVGNRMLSARSRQVERLLLSGALPRQIDAVVTGFGMPMGPLAMGDLAGLDIGWKSKGGGSRRSKVSDALCESGRFGQKNGKGYYRYEDGQRTPQPDPEVDRIIADLRARLGMERQDISSEEILERLLYPVMNEGFRILEEGIAARAGDIDVVWIHGYGWPIHHGGPMYHADQIGLAKIAERLSCYAERQDDPALKPSGLLLDLARSGRTVGEWSTQTARK